MKNYLGILYVVGAVFLVTGCAEPKCCHRSQCGVPVGCVIAHTNSPDARVMAVLDRIRAASASAQTFSADFTYSVISVKRQQFIAGKVLLMKPNFARFTYSYMANPAFPNPVVADGEKIYTFTPESFRPDRTFSGGPFDPVPGAQQASGLQAGGGSFSSLPVNPTGDNIHLWDAIPIQAFFDPESALHYLFYADKNELVYEGETVIDGVAYSVLSHHFNHGNIAGGERSEFDQRLYVDPDGFIHMYVLEFTSGGHPGIQIAKLSNIQTNIPMTKESFVFVPPAPQPTGK